MKFGIPSSRSRARPRSTITSIGLTHTFNRRSFFLGAVQGGVGILLAVRMGYLAVAENEKYRLASESNRVNLSAGFSTATAPRSPRTARRSAST
jgi:penicillin-binding protein 2